MDEWPELSDAEKGLIFDYKIISVYHVQYLYFMCSCIYLSDFVTGHARALSEEVLFQHWIHKFKADQHKENRLLVLTQYRVTSFKITKLNGLTVSDIFT